MGSTACCHHRARLHSRSIIWGSLYCSSRFDCITRSIMGFSWQPRTSEGWVWKWLCCFLCLFSATAVESDLLEVPLPSPGPTSSSPQLFVRCSWLGLMQRTVFWAFSIGGCLVLSLIFLMKSDPGRKKKVCLYSHGGFLMKTVCWCEIENRLTGILIYQHASSGGTMRMQCTWFCLVFSQIGICFVLWLELCVLPVSGLGIIFALQLELCAFPDSGSGIWSQNDRRSLTSPEAHFSWNWPLQIQINAFCFTAVSIIALGLPHSCSFSSQHVSRWLSPKAPHIGLRGGRSWDPCA